MDILCDKCKRDYEESDGQINSDADLICPDCVEDENNS